jgi:hypothetical protein
VDRDHTCHGIDHIHHAIAGCISVLQQDYNSMSGVQAHV